eukprot:gene2668-5561_t
MSSASTVETEQAINNACKSLGGVFKRYSCKHVSWDDACRGTVGGSLSCWGANITDTYLKERQGKPLFTVRSDNWNEKLGRISSDKVAVIVGNHVPGGEPLHAITLRSLLKNIAQYGKYANVPEGTELSDDKLDQNVSIRFQTTFLPVPETDKATMEFATEAYNYNTRSDRNPRNLIVLATTQGVAIQQDGVGAKKLLHHAVDSSGKAFKYWLEAERSSHAVGGAQNETDEERADAVKRGKATAAVIGIPAMGTRFNALMTIQVPVKQKHEERLPMSAVMGQINPTSTKKKKHGFSIIPAMFKSHASGVPQCQPISSIMSQEIYSSSADDDADSDTCFGGLEPPTGAFQTRKGLAMVHSRAPRGISNAARVSRGTCDGTYDGLTVRHLSRDPSQHLTVTVVFYNTVAGGVPSVEDVKAAILDMEELYKACLWSGNLVDDQADFMKEELTVKNVADIATKVTEQPYIPASQPVLNYDRFPTD